MNVRKGTVCFFERLKLAVSRLTLPDDLQLFDSQYTQNITCILVRRLMLLLQLNNYCPLTRNELARSLKTQ